MNLDLAQRHVVITGGSKGIGLACAEEFLNEGAIVTLISRQSENLKIALNKLLALGHPEEKIQTIAADLSRQELALKALDVAEAKTGHVHILVNSAGAAKRTPAAELSPQAWMEAMQSKFFTYINMMDPVIKRMATRGKGSIVNIIGQGGKVASPQHLAGGSANAALMLASAGLANAYAHLGVRVNGINPGNTLTERLQKNIAVEAKLKEISEQQAEAQLTNKLPLGRMAEPKEIAQAVLFLSSDRASYITGVILQMDGALTPMV